MRPGCFPRLGNVHFDLGDVATAREHYEEALRLHTDLGENGRVARAHTALARLDLHEKRIDAALRHLEIALPTLVAQNRRDDEMQALALLLRARPEERESEERLRALLDSCENPVVRRDAEAVLEALENLP